MAEQCRRDCPYIEYLREWAYDENDSSYEERVAAEDALREFRESGELEVCPGRQRFTQDIDVELPFQFIRAKLGAALVRHETNEVFRCPPADFPGEGALQGYDAQ